MPSAAETADIVLPLLTSAGSAVICAPEIAAFTGSATEPERVAFAELDCGVDGLATRSSRADSKKRKRLLVFMGSSSPSRAGAKRLADERTPSWSEQRGLQTSPVSWLGGKGLRWIAVRRNLFG